MVGIFKKCGCPKTGKRLPTRSPQFPVTGFYGQPKINCRGQHITTEGWRTNDSSSSWGPCYSETSRFDMRKFNVHTRFQTKFFRLNAKHIIYILNNFISYGHLNFNRFLCDCWHLAGTPNFSAGCVLASATPNRKPCKVWIRYPVYTNSTEFLSFGDGLVMFSG
jgi:hypothetical protein